MSHHTSDNPLAGLRPDARREIIENLRNGTALSSELDVLAKQEKQLQDEVGPTGNFPDGKLVPHDEGGLIFGITVFNGRVVMDFGKPIRSIGFTRDGALELAELLQQRAAQCPPIIG